MPAFICNTCGTQYAPGEKPPAACPICDDERQYVATAGQSWTTLPALQAPLLGQEGSVYSYFTPLLSRGGVAPQATGWCGVRTNGLRRVSTAGEAP